MTVNVKKILTWTIVLFIAFYIISQPQPSADVVTGILGALRDAGSQIGTFLRSLVHR